MKHRSARAAARLGMILCLLTLPVSLLWAQNENETVGFQSNHIFESGQFGENIDVLNGGLNLTIPIGPKYQINDRLGYQLVLYYNSKIWDYSNFSSSSGDSVRAIHEGPMGIGFTLSFGRLLQDAHNTTCGEATCYQRTWKWITSDGNQHDIWHAQGSPTEPGAYPLKTGDTTYIRVLPGGGCASQITVPCKTVTTPDGLTYTLSHSVIYPESIDQNLRADNLSFGGWYVTRIEDRSVGGPDATTGLYANHVVITYDMRANFEHAIKEIRDSRGRVITFKNCRYTGQNSCVDDSTAATDRSEVATYQIDVPAFSGLENVASGTTATYKFTYEYKEVNRAHPGGGGMTVPPAGKVLELDRLDYPTYVPRDQTYSLYFGYGSYAELICRTLPLLLDVSKTCATWGGDPPTFAGAKTRFVYDYEEYTYLPLYLTPNSTGLGFANNGTPSREVSAKRILEPGPNGTVTRSWTYVREATQGTTNPSRVTLTDAVGNDTVYYYHASYMPANDNPDAQVGIYPDDGLAPEWNDGLNYKIEYYRGTEPGRVLVRTENREYDADMQIHDGRNQRGKENTRVRRTATVFNDDGGKEAVVSNNGWDGFGNWRTVSETGFGVPGVRNTHTDYYTIDLTSYLTGLSNYKEIHDGYRVLERTDNFYNSTDGRLRSTIARKTLPGTLGSLKQPSSQTGDVKTVYRYDYDANLPADEQPSDGLLTGRLVGKSIYSKGDSSTIADYCIGYGWTSGAYLKSKAFKGCETGQQFNLKTIDRKRDGNTGLIYSVKDPAGFETTYLYDTLGRLTGITPPAPEFPTAVDYVSLTETTVTRNPGSTTDFGFSRYRYDDFGRVMCEEKRQADLSSVYPYKTKRYDALNRVVFESEWLLPGATPCDPSTTSGTTSDYGTPPDPFGRVQRTTTADGKVTTVSYQGQDSTVTVEGVVGPGGVAGPVTANYFRDAWGRLIMVDAPSTGGADATYEYDLRDNLARVDLYDQANPLIKQSRFFEYDGLNKLFQSINPENNTSVFSDYDGLGNARSITGADGATLVHTYDPAGRLKAVQRSGSTILLVENTYDVGTNAAGKISTSISRNDGGGMVVTKSYAYGGLNGRLSVLTQTFGGLTSALPLSYGYDNYGNVSALTYPEGPASHGGNLRVDYTHVNGIPAAVQEFGTGLVLAAVAYNPAGGIRTLTTPQSMKTEIAADIRNRPLRITIGRGTYNPDPAVDSFSDRTDYQSGTYRYDGAGNIYAMERANGLMNLYRYDAANRLLEAYDQVGPDTTTYTQYTQCFRYDDFGNILGKKDRATTSSCTGITDGEDLIFMVTPPAGANTNRILNEQRKGLSTVVNFVYDAKGNLVKDWERRYRYDTLNRMVSVSRVSNISDMSSPSTELGRYDYDGGGNRVAKVDSQRELKTFYVRGPDGRILSEFRRTELGSYQPEWSQHHVYLAGREVGLRENRLPNPPGGLSVSTTRLGSLSDVVVKWRKNPAEDSVTTYRVYRSGASGMTLVGTSNTPCADPAFICYTDAGLPSDDFFEYQVTAVSASGESYGSDQTWLIAGDVTAPYRPTCLTGSAADRQVTLSWNASVSDDVLGYNVYRRLGTSGPGQYTKVNQVLVSGPAYLDSGLTNDQVYSYRVRAVDQVGRESTDVVNGGKTCLGTGVACTTDADCTCLECEYQCTYVCGNTTNTTFSAMPKDYAPPGPPREVGVVGDCAGNGTAQVTWAANADTDNVVTYWVYRTPEFSPPGPRSSGNDALGQPKLFFADSGLASGTTYYYSLKAEDSKVNRSVFSLQVGTRPRAPAGQLPPPPNQLSTKAGDGQVRVRFQKPQNMTGIVSFVIYRKPNAEPSCTAFQELHEYKSDEWLQYATYLDYNDGTAGNAVAWDYAIASRDSSGNESAFSRLGLAIPVAPPKNYRECVEIGPPWSPPGVDGEGAYWCNPDSRRTVLRWSPPPGKPYHPISASNADGTLGYFVGYHVKRYSSKFNGNTDSSFLVTSPFYEFGSTDISIEPKSRNLYCSTTVAPSNYCSGEWDTHCQEWETCVSMGQCYMDSNPTCDRGNGAADCAAGTYCYGTCSQMPSTRCRADADCGAGGGTCGAAGQCYMTLDPWYGPPCIQKADCPATASCRRYDYGFFYGPLPTDPYLHEGADLVEYYPNWVYYKECGTVSAVYKVYANGNWQSVISESTNFDPTKTGADSSEVNARCTGALLQCNTNAPLCSEATEPPEVTQAPTVTSPGPGRIKVTWDTYAGSANAAGYYLYVKEVFIQSLNGVNKPPHPYGFSNPLPYVTVGLDPPCVDNGKPCYELTGISTKGRIDTNVKYQFQIAAFDPAGNVGRASPLSAAIAPQAPMDPVGLKTVIWTVNDASIDGPTSWGVANPRSFDGIKLQWTGTANRVYRSEAPDGPFCVILQVGQGNPTDRPICADSTAYSTTQTTGQSGTNVRFFHDRNVIAGKVYYYKVTTLNGGSESGFSNEVQGMALKRPAQPLSPPRHLKAWAPMVQQPGFTWGGWEAGPGIYLRWCPNPAEEGVTGYRVYRAIVPGGPYTDANKIADIDNPTGASTLATNCLLGSQRCEIGSTTCGSCTTPPCLCKSGDCTIGPGGTCKVVDLYNISYPLYNSDPLDQTQRYFYVVSAVRGTEESGFSNENVALPNYFCETCIPPAYQRRFDPDNEGDIACDDEMAAFEPGEEGADSLATMLDESGGSSAAGIPGLPTGGDPLAPYRVIGSKIPSYGGVGGNPAPSAVSRWLFYHTDHLGSPRVIADASGAVVSTHHYMPFGEEKPIAGRVSANSVMFTGHQRDVESASSDNPDGLDYMVARYYSSSLGRFMAVDPIGGRPANPQTWNRYSYVLNNPIRFIDPDGRKLNKAGQERAKKAGKDNSLTKEEKETIKKAEESDTEINLTESDQSKVRVTPRDGGEPEDTTGSTKDAKKKLGEAKISGDKAQTVDGETKPQVDDKGKVTSADITIYGGNQPISPLGQAAGRSPEQFKNKVFVEELKHIEGGKVRTEAEVGHPE